MRIIFLFAAYLVPIFLLGFDGPAFSADQPGTSTVMIEDKFVWCVRSNDTTYISGMRSCRKGDREGIMCDLSTGKRIFMRDPAICEKRGGKSE